MDVYVYYRVRDALSAELQTRANALQAGLRRACGVHAQLKRRPESSNGFQTWMEVYLDIPDDFDAALERAVAGANLLPLIDGSRHVEYFLDCSPCA